MKLFNIVLATASAMGMGKLNPQAMGKLNPDDHEMGLVVPESQATGLIVPEILVPEDQPAIKVAHSCEWDYQGENNRLINCEADEALDILDAWYGRENSSTCNVARGGGILYNAPGACRRDAKAVIEGRCNGQRACALAFGNGFVGDPCVGTTKYLEVYYRCVKIAVPQQAPEIHIDEPKKMM
ncbi:unnamed protein product [Oikopleura dioica]|uniref:SUEL-type lectin domain-containing protein n=1 Tax=Oikopleura dioica TaxID=34765 RepID=E4XVL1_OIKDI|nr:unnamed protein product [Oikopleura dioica]CBY41023.1 unnamed protein product [Oikopleura dioica]